jgi:hypothetical protein
MGQFDDAIREHLELKRRHGAPAEEVQRQEHEALGPIRRRGDPEPEAAYETSVAAGAEPTEPASDAVPDAEVAAPGEASEIIAPPPVMPATEQPVMPEPAGHEPVIEHFPAADGPAATPAHGPSFVDAEPWLDDSPETPPDDVLEPPEDGAAAPVEEDVLEETPEFLQETPEHERLWFEQRPPRGFDFEQ